MLFSLTVLAFIFITGLIIGSFLNVVILRTVSEESIIFPPSKCPKCQTPLKWYHNIPILSFLFLKGKCSFCKEKISWQYPVVELITGVLFVLLFIIYCSPFDVFFGLNSFNMITYPQLITYIFTLIATCLFIIISGTDFIEMKISENHTYSLIGTGILYSIIMAALNFIYYKKAIGMPEINWHFILSCPILYAIGAGIICYLFMEIIRRFTSFVVKTETFGEGDSHIAAGIGTVFGALLGNSISYIYFTQILMALLLIFILSAILPVIFILPLYLKRLFTQKNWFMLGGIAAFIIYSIGYMCAKQYGWLDNNAALILCSVVLLALGLLICRELIIGIKQHKSDGYPCPFGPALASAAIIALLTLPL